MLTPDFLNLQRVQLKVSQEWTLKGEHLTFIFPKGGVGKWIAGAGSQPLATGDVLVLNAILGGKVSVTSPGNLDFWCFSLHLEHLFPLFESSEICLVQNVSDGFRTARLYPAASPMAQECHRRLAGIPDQHNLDHRSRLLHVAVAILTDEFSNGTTRRAGFSRPEEHMIEVFKKLTPVELLNFSISELATKFGCGRRHLNRLFHQHFGVSVAALRMEMRLLRAVTLLRAPDAKIIRVAEDCGFNQLGLFNTCFKRRFGSNPGEWRKLNLKANRAPDRVAPAASSCPLQVNGLCPLTGHTIPAGQALPKHVAAPNGAAPARLAASKKSPKKSGVGEQSKITVASQPVMRKEAHKRIAVQISP